MVKLLAAFQSWSFLQSFHCQYTHSESEIKQFRCCIDTPRNRRGAIKVLMSPNDSHLSRVGDDTSSGPSTNHNDAPVLISSILPPLASGSRRIYLLRHGETDWNVLGKIQGGGFDIPLNDNGRQQAVSTALALEDVPLGVVASSQLSRAKETADILWARHSETVQDRRVIYNGLAEMRFGEFEGLAWRDQELDPALADRFKVISRELKQNVDKAFPGGGESTRDVQKRSTAALHQILQDFPDQQHIAIVSHGRTNKVLIAATAMGDVMKFRDVKQSSKSAGRIPGRFTCI